MSEKTITLTGPNGKVIFTGYVSLKEEISARRIVACVNACAGIPTDKLEAGSLETVKEIFSSAEYKQQRDELLAALKHADEFITNGIEFGFIRIPDKDTPDPARETPGIVKAAIAKVEKP